MNDEKSFILEKAGTMSPEAIAAKLDRTVEFVKRFIKENHVPPKAAASPADARQGEKVVIRQELRSSEKWKRLVQELTKEEIRYFEEEFVKLYAQFRSDVLPSEESQIFDAIKLDLLKSRNMIERRRAREEISRMEHQMELLIKRLGEDVSGWSPDEREFLTNLNNQLTSSRAAEQNKTTEFVKLQERHDKLMENLKATRGQRIKEVESGKQTFLGLLKMLQNRDIKDFEGRQAGLMRLSATKEYERLGQLHKYEDNQYDRPILSADTVGLESPEPAGPEEEAEKEEINNQD